MFRRLADVDSIVVEYSDRLARFGYTYLNDLINIVTCFSARLFGAIGGRKAKKDMEKVIQELEQERSVNSENNNESSPRE
ncbi:MAG TPA: hypothetical protein VIK72_15900 [Clostridiaceae bacterium]